jgi:hypothetical protein
MSSSRNHGNRDKKKSSYAVLVSGVGMKSSIFALTLFAGVIGISQNSQAGSERRGDHGDSDHREYDHYRGYDSDHRWDYDRDYNWDDYYWHDRHFGYWRHHRGYWTYRGGEHIFINVY